MRKVLFLTAVLAFIFTSSVWAADVSGNWTLKMSGPQGEESIPMVIKASGENLAVTATHPSFSEMTGTGTLKGNDITFNLKSGMEFVFTGTVNGNKMSGTREMKMGEGGGQGGGGASGGQGGGQQGGAAPSGQGGGQQGGAAPSGQAGGQQGGGQGGGQTMSNDWTAEKN